MVTTTMSTTSKHVKNKIGQEDGKNFIKKVVEIPEVEKAQHPVKKETKPIYIPPQKATSVIETNIPFIEINNETKNQELNKLDSIKQEEIVYKKTEIIPENTHEIEKPTNISLSIDSDDVNVDYNALSEFLENDTKRNKNKIAIEFEERGEKLIQEIEIKKNIETVKKYEYIPYILKYSKGKYTAEELLSYSLNDVKAIFLDIKEEKKSKSFIIKFFKFILNI
jgi:hypothetical protein